MPDTNTRPLHEIADEIAADWKNIYFGAAPYISAMKRMNTIDGGFYDDPGKEVVLKFLTNASTWRGDVARRIKAELKGMLK